MLQAQIFVDNDEIRDSKPLYEYIMNYLIQHEIDGATVFQAMLGFGGNHQLKRPNDLFSFDETSMMITFIDQEEKVKNVLTKLREEVKVGLIVTNQVHKW